MTTDDDLETQYRDTVSHMEATQRRLGTLTRDDPAREDAKRELEAAVTRVRELKEAIKQQTTRRNFAGLTSPLFEVVVARLSADLVAELERAALAIQEERDRRGAERRAAKAAATPAAPPPPPPVPVLMPHATGVLRHGMKMPPVYRAVARPMPPAPQPAPPAAPLPSSPPPRSTGGLRSEVAGMFAEARRFR